MRYIIIDVSRGDMFTKEYEDKAEALKQAEIDFSYLTKADIKERSDFYVLESANPDEEAENHYDGEVVKRWI
jgi:hypothetical protein